MKKSQLFSQVPIKKPKRNYFDLSHEVKMSAKMGSLIPFLCIDTVPGDTFMNNSEIMLRMAPMLAPVYHRVNVTTHFFFVPNRLIWNEWEDFITGGRNGDLEPIPPHFVPSELSTEQAALVQESTLWDYLGLPPIPASEGTESPISSLPFRAYQFIYNEYYRDQNLESEVNVPLTSGAEIPGTFVSLCTLRNRAWEKDYFTSALPWTQRGEQVLIPMEGESDIVYSPIALFTGGDNGALSTNIDSEIISSTGGTGEVRNLDDVTFTNASVTINDLRRSIRLQEWLEANARGGARYTEQIMVHFGVAVPDYRLQRPEYLGGGKAPVVISEVLASATTEGANNGDVGDFAGHGLSLGTQNRFSYTCQEHGWIIGIMSVMPRTAYQDGIPKRFLRNNKFDYFWKEFANIGEQPILGKELFYDSDNLGNEAIFGYTPRYAEYKYENDRVSGQFRSSLDYWHLGRKFNARPTLTSAFVQCRPFAEDLNRIFYTTSDVDNLWIYVMNHTKAKRPMPYFGVPTI